MRKSNFALRLQPSLLTEAAGSRKQKVWHSISLLTWQWQKNFLLFVPRMQALEGCGRARSAQPRRYEREYRVARRFPSQKA